MKRSPVTLEDVTSWKTLVSAFGKAALGKRGRRDVEAFRSNLDRNLHVLQQQLLDERYCPDAMRAFSIRDPKPRMIHAPSFRDRVVHHALMTHIGPVLDRSLIFDSYACRVGKGSHRAVARAAKFSNRAAWYVHADVAKYFPSIDHFVLRAQLAHKFRDKRLLRLVDQILDGHSDQKGLPIGALTSQNFANAYLSSVDRLVTEHRSAIGYVRYMDDMVWWCPSRKDCQTILSEVKSALLRLRLVLKIEPTPQRTRDGMTFCGYRVLPGKILLSSRRRQRFTTHLQSAERDCEARIVSPGELQKRMDPVLATVRYARSWRWRTERLGLVSRQLDV